MNYPVYIKKLRDKMFLSQSDLAKILNVSNVTICRWELGKFEPTIKCKKQLNKLFIKANLIKEEK